MKQSGSPEVLVGVCEPATAGRLIAAGGSAAETGEGVGGSMHGHGDAETVTGSPAIFLTIDD